MALRNIKIARELIQNCQKLCTARQDFSPLLARTATVDNEQLGKLSHNVDSTEKPIKLVDVKLAEEEKTPDMSSAFVFESAQTCFNGSKEASKYSTFIESMKPLRRPILTLYDKDKLGLNLRVEGDEYRGVRNFTSLAGSSRFYSKSCKRKKPKKTVKKLPCPLKKVGLCPKVKMGSSGKCEESKGSDCLHHYKDPKCCKKLAPYPSYSETCVEKLVDDPSECFQCPWKSCEGVDSIRPNKKREYHTSTRPLSFSSLDTSINLSAMVPGLSPVSEVLFDARKKPCPRPPGICEQRKKSENKQKEQKPKKKNKKAAPFEWSDKFGMWMAHPSPRDAQLNPYTLEPLPMELPNGAPMDDVQLKKNRWPNCPIKIRRVKEHRHFNEMRLVDSKRGDIHPTPCPTGETPPPCVEEEKSDPKCPEGVNKKPKYRKERPYNRPFYKKPGDPYNSTGYSNSEE